MSTTVTLHIYSGRPDPSWQLTPEEEDQLSQRLQSLTEYTDRKPSGVFGGLGYRGFSIRRAIEAPTGPLNLFMHEGIIDQGAGLPNIVDRAELERWLLSTTRRTVNGEALRHVQEVIERRGAERFSTQLNATEGACPACQAADAPKYNPSTWNIPTVQPYNNCYNYANDNPTNTFAQPGRAAGHPAQRMACNEVTAAATSDGLQSVAGFAATLKPGAGWYVALVVWPNQDYHWYRQDDVGCWSHKPGQTAVRNVDNSGNKISDPQRCNRGPYSDFCGYMVTKRGIKIQ